MRAHIQQILMRWAYRPFSGGRLRRVLRHIARYMLNADTDPDLETGSFDVTMAPAEHELTSSDYLQSAANAFGPLHHAVAVARGMTIEASDISLPSVSPPAVRLSDPDVDDWLQEVTEPYILWDSPKPSFALYSDYFYDYAEPLPQAHMPLYVRPLEPLYPRTENPCSVAFSRLSKDRALFTLSPEAVRLRTTH